MSVYRKGPERYINIRIDVLRAVECCEINLIPRTVKVKDIENRILR